MSVASSPPPETGTQNQNACLGGPEKVPPTDTQQVKNPLVRYRTELRSTADGGSVSFPGLGEDDAPAADDAAVMEYVDVCFTNEKLKPSDSADKRRSDYLDQRKGHPYIRILSPAVNEALRCTVNYYPEVDLSSRVVKIYEPYDIIVFYEQQLTEYRKRLELGTDENLDTSCPNRHAARDLLVVQNFVQEQVGTAVEAERERHARGQATFDMLWLLFKPGCEVFFDESSIGEYDPYIFRSIDYSLTNGATENYTITCWNIDADSSWVGPCQSSATVARFAGEKNIVELKLYPCEYLRFDPDVSTEDLVGIRQHFIERGRRWYELRRTTKCWYFEGTTVTVPRHTFSSLAIVDPIQYAWDMNHERRTLVTTVEHPSTPLRICSCSRCERLIYSCVVKPRFKGYSRIDPFAQETLTDEQYFICDPDVEAFLFKQRSWQRVQVSGFKEATFDKTLFSNLVLNGGLKDLIYHLTQIYMRDSLQSRSFEPDNYMAVKLSTVHKRQGKKYREQQTWSADFIEGKGECLTFLLHGKPGVGKTYTAECIAAHMERPLLTLTCSDIGVSPERIESKLMNWFKLADRWGAIILIDEADIYMEERRTQDIERNHLVAGFIRALEYFKGILFLTTNRVGTFDEAFISRIHMQIYYKEFDDKERDGVWNTFFDKLESERDDRMRISQAAKDYTQSAELRALRWNGREIRNAFQVAVALAEAKGQKDSKGLILIKPEHIKASVHMSAEFKDYLEKLHKQTHAKRAALHGYRFDAYGADEGQAEKF